MLEYKGQQRAQVVDMLDGMSTTEELTDWIMGWGGTWGVNGQIGLCNTLYRIAQQRGWIVGGAQTLGERINIEQNHSKHPLSEKQASAVARDIVSYSATVKEAQTKYET